MVKEERNEKKEETSVHTGGYFCRRVELVGPSWVAQLKELQFPGKWRNVKGFRANESARSVRKFLVAQRVGVTAANAVAVQRI